MRTKIIAVRWKQLINTINWANDSLVRLHKAGQLNTPESQRVCDISAEALRELEEE